MARKAAPVAMDYAVCDLVGFRRTREEQHPERRWSTAIRIIGFNGEEVAWGLCEGVLVAIATDKIRPCIPNETLAYLYLNKNKPNVDVEAMRLDEQEQFKFIGLRSKSRATKTPKVKRDLRTKATK
eukprot:7336560-Karenia_brevis.AAC.1